MRTRMNPAEYCDKGAKNERFFPGRKIDEVIWEEERQKEKSFESPVGSQEGGQCQQSQPAGKIGREAGGCCQLGFEPSQKKEAETQTDCSIWTG